MGIRHCSRAANDRLVSEVYAVKATERHDGGGIGLILDRSKNIHAYRKILVWFGLGGGDAFLLGSGTIIIHRGEDVKEKIAGILFGKGGAAAWITLDKEGRV